MPLFSFRIKRIFVRDNREFGNGELKIISFITTEDAPLPILDGFFETNDPAEKKKLVKAAVETVISSKTLMQLGYVTDNHNIYFGNTGYSLWTSGVFLKSFNWQMILAEMDDDIRHIGDRIRETINTPEFDSFLNNLMVLASVSANPTVTVAIQAGKYVLNQVAAALLNNKDDQVGLVYQSFIDGVDYNLENELEKQGYFNTEIKDIPDMSGNLSMDIQMVGRK